MATTQKEKRKLLNCLKAVFFLWCIFFFASLSAQSDRQPWFVGDETSNTTMLFENQFSDPFSSNLKGLIDLSESAVIYANSSVISFYTNGQVVLNEFSDPMPNGRVLKGSPRSMQGCVVVENPAVCDQQYIFYTESSDQSFPRKIYYSVVDKNIPVEDFLFTSYGDVLPSQKDIDITPSGSDIGESLYSLEKTVYKEGSWILSSSRNEKAIHIYNIDAQGVQLHKSYDLQEVIPGFGGIDFTTIKFDSYRQDERTSIITFALSNEEGIYGHPIVGFLFSHEEGTIDASSMKTIAQNTTSVYGTAFSQDGTKFYYSDFIDKTLHQYDLDTETTTLIGTSAHTGRTGGLKRAINNKIYWANQFSNDSEGGLINSVSVITQPDRPGTMCDLQMNGYPLSSSAPPKRLGIFPIVRNDLLPPKLVVIDQPTCGSSDGQLSVFLDPKLEPLTYMWSDGTNQRTNANVNKGDYALTMTTLDGCVFMDSIVLTELVNYTIEDILVSATNAPDCIVPEGIVTLQSQNFIPNTSFEIEFIDDNQEEFFYSEEVSQEQELNLQNLPVGIYYNFKIRPAFSDCFVVLMDTVVVDAEFDPLDIGKDTLLCMGDSYLVSPKTDYATYRWSDGSEGSELVIRETGDYMLSITTEGGCIDADTVYVQFAERPNVSLEPSLSLDIGESTVISPDVNSEEDLSYNWSPPDGLSCTDCLSPTATPQSNRSYTFEAFNESQCVDSASILINVKNNAGLIFPNVFSPNGDNVNDIFDFVIVSDLVQEVRSFNIYNRWGEEVFTQMNIDIPSSNHGWNGSWKDRIVDSGVYIYVVEVLLTTGEKIKKAGDVMVLD